MEKIKILYITRLFRGSTSLGFLNGFRKLGHAVEEVDTSKWLGNWSLSLIERLARKLRRGGVAKNDILEMNSYICKVANDFEPDLIFFVGDSYILPSTLEITGRSGLNMVMFNDDMLNPVCQSSDFFENLPFWDCVFVPRKVNILEFKELGINRVELMRFAYIPNYHRLITPTVQELEKYKSDVVFIGSFISSARADLLAEIITGCPGVNIKVFGGGWNNLKRPIYWLNPRRWRTWTNLLKVCNNNYLWFEEMSLAFNSSKIVLGLLNHNNRDLHTSRTLEIPACGGFMLMERTTEHLEMFREGVEAEFFESVEEATEKIQYYLAHEGERKRIAKAGYDRCVNSDYSYDHRAKTVLEVYQELISK